MQKFKLTARLRSFLPVELRHLRFLLGCIWSRDDTTVYFDWTPAPETATVPPSRWNEAVTQPLHDLGLALLMAGSALGRLIVGLADYREYLVAGRGRVMSNLDANRP